MLVVKCVSVYVELSQGERKGRLGPAVLVEPDQRSHLKFSHVIAHRGQLGYTKVKSSDFHTVQLR